MTRQLTARRLASAAGLAAGNRFRPLALTVVAVLLALAAGLLSPISMAWPGSQNSSVPVAVTAAVNTNNSIPNTHQQYRISAGHSHGPPTAVNALFCDEQTYYVLAGDTPVLVHNCDQHVALGLESAGLDDLARRQGAETLMNDKDWRGTVWTAANLLKFENPGIRVSFHLDGMAGSADGVLPAVMQSLSRNSRQVGGATDLEMSFFNDAGTLGKVDFFLGGIKQLNPFA